MNKTITQFEFGGMRNRIISDGQDFYIQWGNYFFKIPDAQVTDMTITQSSPAINVTSLGGGPQFIRGPTHFTLDLSLTGTGAEIREDDPIRTLLEKFSVLDLARTINRKLR
jgi:hypothetical protein